MAKYLVRAVVSGLVLLSLGIGLIVGWQMAPAIRFLRSGEKISWVWLQNSDELRATGGFLGSYAVVKTDGLEIKEVRVTDIYEPDGQMSGFVGAPAGVREYLSDGHGWRLTDVNWSADFPTAASEFQQMMELTGFEKSEKGGEPDLMIAINSRLIGQLIDVLGGIQLIDYQGIKVSGENFEEMARADRDDFFPGSKQKVNFLKHLAQQTQYRLKKLTIREKWQIANLLYQAGKQKNLQVWPAAKYSELRKLARQFDVDGRMRTRQEKSELFLLSVESNVGINKANSRISRQSAAEIISDRESQTTTIKLEIGWQNNNQEPENYYSNYQRFFIDAEAILAELIIDDREIKAWDEKIVTLSDGRQVKQVGFLMAFEAGKNARLQATFKIPRLIKTINWDCQAGVENNLIINHQSLPR